MEDERIKERPMTKWGPEYLSFIERFISGEMSASDFVKYFFILNPTIEIEGEGEYLIYMEIFYAAEAFDPNGLVVYGPSIGEEELRHAVAGCFIKLKAAASAQTI